MTITLHTLPLEPGVIGGAWFCEHHVLADPFTVAGDQPCHRWVLTRELHDLIHEVVVGNGHVCRTLCCIGMNPSAANDRVDDTTVRLVWRLARRHEYCKLAMLNAYAYRATSPADMKEAALRGMDIVGDRNASAVLAFALQADNVLCAWGAIDAQRDAELRALLVSNGLKDRLFCLALTQQGFPRHPARTATIGVNWKRLPPVRDANETPRVRTGNS